MPRTRTSGQGRPKGAKNKKTLELQRRVAKGGISPLDYMLKVMRNPRADLARRDDMGKAAAPYVHARLSSVEATGKDGSPLMPPSSDPLEVARKLAFLLNSANRKTTTET